MNEYLRRLGNCPSCKNAIHIDYYGDLHSGYNELFGGTEETNNYHIGSYSFSFKCQHCGLEDCDIVIND